MSDKRGSKDPVDDIINNPAFELFGGYQIFIRRMAIPTFLLLFALIIWSLTQNKIITAILTGIMVGPAFNFDRGLAEYIRRRRSR